MQIHEEFINSGIVLDNFISSSLVKMYGKCGHLEMAIEVFEQIPKKTIVTWNSMISGYGLKALGVENARTLIDKDPDDSLTYILLLNVYASVQKWDEVHMARSKMKKLGLKKNPGCSWIEINQKILPFFVEV
ncbi:hypothetical protein VNO78_16261 [Psophocarpus tetragonolobus]|uniref:Pentatricopeptide repeat-containing protein n=1 Tax=Psophocarpus tetragonolobus TaxID=3891 RepID=A0AAN9SI06_PSOTE